MIRRISAERLKNRDGTLLLEVLLALVIMSISLGVIIQTMTGSLRAARFAAQYTQAALAADAEMTNLIKELHFQDTGPDRTSQIDAEAPSVFGFTVDTEASPEASNLEVATLTAEWQSGSKTNRLQLSTYYRTSL